jgi:hypothetical protein
MTKETTPAQDAPIEQLSDHYHKGRKFYTLSSGLLLAWTLVGIEIEKAPIESLNVSLKNPDVTPIILVLLVLYFAYRTVVEWYQSDARRRRLPASRWDFAGANALGVISLAVYSFQEISSVNVGEYLSRVIPLAIPNLLYSISDLIFSYYIARLVIWSFLTPPKSQTEAWFYNRFPLLWTERTSRIPMLLFPKFMSKFIAYDVSIESTGFVGRVLFTINFAWLVILLPILSIVLLYNGLVNEFFTQVQSQWLTSLWLILGCICAWFVRYWRYDLIINPSIRRQLGLHDRVTDYD